MLLFVWSIKNLSGLIFQIKISDYYPRDSKALSDNRKYTELFRTDVDQRVMAIISAHQSIYDRAFFNGLIDFTNQIEKQNNINSTHSILNLQIPYFTNVGVINIPAIHYNDPSQYTNDSLRIVKNLILTNHLISNDHKSVCVFIDFQEDLGEGDYLQVLNNIRKLGKAKDFTGFYLMGPKVIESTYSELMIKELKNLGLILFLALAIATRCRCPPLSFTPLSPINVSSPFSNRTENSLT